MGAVSHRQDPTCCRQRRSLPCFNAPRANGGGCCGHLQPARLTVWSVSSTAPQARLSAPLASASGTATITPGAGCRRCHRVAFRLGPPSSSLVCSRCVGSVLDPRVAGSTDHPSTQPCSSAWCISERLHDRQKSPAHPSREGRPGDGAPGGPATTVLVPEPTCRWSTISSISISNCLKPSLQHRCLERARPPPRDVRARPRPDRPQRRFVSTRRTLRVQPNAWRRSDCDFRRWLRSGARDAAAGVVG